ncbi:MAG TPA: hypothetical protein VIN72_00215 [Lutibacter sp.]
MKKLLKFVILIIIINQPIQVFSQTYNINSTTKEISNYSKIINFSKITKYDLEFEEYLDTQDMNTKISILIYEGGAGKMELAQEGYGKWTYILYSCKEKKYKNSEKLVWEIVCLKEDLIPIVFYLDFKNYRIDRMWIKSKETNSIYYYTN